MKTGTEMFSCSLERFTAGLHARLPGLGATLRR
jgi:hypothetical protein